MGSGQKFSKINGWVGGGGGRAVINKNTIKKARFGAPRSCQGRGGGKTIQNRLASSNSLGLFCFKIDQNRH